MTEYEFLTRLLTPTDADRLAEAKAYGYQTWEAFCKAWGGATWRDLENDTAGSTRNNSPLPRIESEHRQAID